MTQYSQSPMGASGTSSATGASNPYYNLISVLYHTLQAAETYDTYIRDAEQLGDNELTQFLRQVQTEDRKTTISFNNSDLDADSDGVILSGFSLAASRAAGTYIADVLTKDAATVASIRWAQDGHVDACDSTCARSSRASCPALYRSKS